MVAYKCVKQLALDRCKIHLHSSQCILIHVTICTGRETATCAMTWKAAAVWRSGSFYGWLRSFENGLELRKSGRTLPTESCRRGGAGRSGRSANSGRRRCSDMDKDGSMVDEAESSCGGRDDDVGGKPSHCASLCTIGLHPNFRLRPHSHRNNSTLYCICRVVLDNSLV